ncbi:UDP-glucose 4-epimerase family protein [Pseudomonas fluorescens]|uniref:N-acetyl-alpha-D-glucosaminyl-diphospho-ditrans, octacis-undecaprenol 4-epimerase n=1 Tax=Pseudomonas fluorescens TaxID=294 RepID=A0A5E7RN84_PSEFL|nr:SDR family oxidoreductase [Pseudomonas fluorescens]VVP74777.1 N-acetyl-alpha-D-glucosaminyl-diphospho-ditrans, octacis-undecaprenol 4-epimerase [Pseudomonas fluorescens]
MKRAKILVTGASGFVGSALVIRLGSSLKYNVIAAVRSLHSTFPAGVAVCNVGDLSHATDYNDALIGVDVVVHAAARVHVINEKESDPLAMFRSVNVEGTLNLARQAANHGVKRFIFLSSIKVNGEGGRKIRPYRSEDSPNPLDPYGVSKLEAEVGLQQIAKYSNMEVVIIRPPLIYGPGVKANFYTMMRWLNRGVPLPLGAIYNKRSFVSVDNLVDLIYTCLEHPNAANEIFLVSDGQDLSTTELLRHMGHSLGKPARLIPVPECLVRTAGMLLCRRALSSRLLDSLQVDIDKTRNVLGWHPPISVTQALNSTAQYFLKKQNHE